MFPALYAFGMSDEGREIVADDANGPLARLLQMSKAYKNDQDKGQG